MKFLLTTIFLLFAHVSFSQNLANLSATQNNNVCKELKGKIVLYAIFVDTKSSHAWTDHDIKSTIDSIHVAINWMEKQAQEAKIPLSIQLVYHENGGRVPISEKFPKKSFIRSYSPSITPINKWADKIAKRAFNSVKSNNSISKIRTSLKASNREQLIARLRDVYQTDNVALMYFINDYYKSNPSITLNSSFTNDVEYSIVSFKYPLAIAHEFIHLFGALDFYGYGKTSRRYRKALKISKEYYSHCLFTNLKSYNLSDTYLSGLTKYLIGWNKSISSIDKKIVRLISIRRRRFIFF